jgi:tyrosinase
MNIQNMDMMHKDMIHMDMMKMVNIHIIYILLSSMHIVIYHCSKYFSKLLFYFIYLVLGFDRYGWSRYGSEYDWQFNSLGKFKNPDYADLYVSFFPNASIRVAEDGEVKRYDSTGYDQFGTDIYGRPRAAPCMNEPVADPTYGPISPIDPQIDITPICQQPSEIGQAFGKFLYIRKSAAAMTPDDWTRFRSVWKQLNLDGRIGEYTRTHRTFLSQHNSLRFLPWHREFLARLENDMHLIDPCVTLPYWDTVASPSFPAGIAAGIETDWPPAIRYMTNGTLDTTDAVTRNIGGNALPAATLLTTLMNDATFTLFTGKLEQFHNSIHMFVGGDMASIMSASQDPIFWMVHAYIDKIWSTWQVTHETEPTAALITTIDPLDFHFGPGGDTRTYDNVKKVTLVTTNRGVGYQYI